MLVETLYHENVCSTIRCVTYIVTPLCLLQQHAGIYPVLILLEIDIWHLPTCSLTSNMCPTEEKN